MRHKILFISSWFPNKIEPTNGNFVQRHAEAVAQIHDVEILHAIGDPNQKETYFFDEKINNNIRTIVVYYQQTGNSGVNFFRRMMAYKKGFSKMNRPDLVHANVLHNNMLFAVYLKKRYKIPFVVTEHWTALRKVNENTTSKMIKIIAKSIGNQASRILPVSKELKEGLKDLGIKTPMKVIPNVVDTSVFFPRKIDKIRFTFIHVSNLIPRKNPEKILTTSLNLLEKGYHFNLQIGGDGDVSNLKEIVKSSRFQEKIEVFGIQTIEEIAERMRQSDCFILFSDDENQPCVIAESFATGIQVISTKVGGISEFFPDNGGILLDIVDDRLLENAMKQLLESTISDNYFLVDYARSNFSSETIANAYSLIYEEILKE